MARLLISYLLGLVGAIIGGVLGFYTFHWLIGHGFYGLAIPGAFLGLGCGLLSRHNSILRGILCGVAALILSLYTEWTYLRFAADNSFSYMVSHFMQKDTVTLVMVVLGTVIAFWVGKDGGFHWLPERRRVQATPDEAKEGVKEL
jgi:MFS family permease